MGLCEGDPPEELNAAAGYAKRSARKPTRPYHVRMTRLSGLAQATNSQRFRDLWCRAVTTVIVSVVTLGLLASCAACGNVHEDDGSTATYDPLRRPDDRTAGVPAGMPLEPSGSLTVTEKNQVLNGLDIDGPVIIDVDGAVIRNSRIRGTGPTGVLVRSGSVRIERTEISGFANGISGDHWTANGVDIHSTTEDGVKLGNGVTLENSWIHDLNPSTGAHADGAQMQAGLVDVAIKGNSIDLSTTREANSAIFLAPDMGPDSAGPVLISGNWVDGGNYTLYVVDGDHGKYVVSNITVSDNKFGRSHQYGPASITVPITQSGNVWTDTGEPIVL